MIELLVFIAAISTTTFAAPNDKNFDDVPYEYLSLVPFGYEDHLNNLTVSDKETLKKLSKRLREFKNSEEYMAELNNVASALHNEILNLREALKKRINSLGDAAKKFINQMISDADEQHRKYLETLNRPSLEFVYRKIKNYLEAFLLLDEDAQNELKNEFPITYNTFSNNQLAEVLRKYIKD